MISIGSYGTDSKYVDQGIRAISNEVTDKRIVRKNELTMVLNDKTANGTIIGRCMLIDSDDEFVINQRTEIISPKEMFDSKFAYVVLNGPFREKVKKIVQGGTQIYVNYPAVEKLKISVPSKEEQYKIGSFFKQLDDTIALHQRQLERYQKLKKALLQQIFPEKGTEIPKIRFDNFTEKWEQRKLGEISVITIGEFVIKTKQNDSSPYPVYNGGTSFTGKYDDYNNEGPKVVISARGANAGFVNIVNSKYWAGNSCYSVSISDGNQFSIDYIYHFMKRNQWLFTAYQQAANIPSVSKTDVEKFEIFYPELDEQKEIGLFFNQLANTIALHQKKMREMEKLKQACLSKMFI